MSQSYNKRDGLTLLEIILAIVILGGVVAVLGEVGRMGLQNARASRDLTQAELLCESLMGLIRIGSIPMQSSYDNPVENDYPDTNVISPTRPDTILWYYSVEVNSTVEDGLLEVAVTVWQNQPLDPRPISCRLVCWMIDPEYLEELETEMQEILNPEEE